VGPSGRRRAAATGFVVTAAMTATILGITIPAGASGSGTSRDQQLAVSAVLRRGDLPAGWSAQPTSPPARADQILSGIAACARYEAARQRIRKYPTAETSFAHQGMVVDSSVWILPTTTIAKQFIGVAAATSTTTCLQQFLTTVVSTSIATNGSTVALKGVTGHRTPVPPAGNQAVGSEFVFTLGANGVVSRTYVEIEYVRVGRSAAQFSFESTNGVFPDLRNTLTQAVVRRLPSR